jgi:hypothetical protein
MLVESNFYTLDPMARTAATNSAVVATSFLAKLPRWNRFARR